MQFRLAGKFVQAANLMIELSLEDDTRDDLIEDAVGLFVQENKPAQAAQ